MTILLAIASHVSYHQVELSIKTKYDLRFRAKVTSLNLVLTWKSILGTLRQKVSLY